MLYGLNKDNVFLLYKKLGYVRELSDGLRYDIWFTRVYIYMCELIEERDMSCYLPPSCQSDWSILSSDKKKSKSFCLRIQANSGKDDAYA